MTWRAEVKDFPWFGHGESGTVSRIVIDPGRPMAIYSTPEHERRELVKLAEEINHLKFRMEGLEK